MQHSAASDEELMVHVQGGDRSAYEELYARWKDQVFAFLVRRTGASQHAEEAHQETWLRVYRHREKFDTQRSFRPWLFTIAANAGRDCKRPDPTLFRMPGKGDDIAALKDLLVFALHAISPLDRRLLLLTAEGFSSRELAEIEDMNPPAVRARLSRARRSIREAIDEQ